MDQKRLDPHLHRAYNLAEWRKETDDEQKSNQVHAESDGGKR